MPKDIQKRSEACVEAGRESEKTEMRVVVSLTAASSGPFAGRGWRFRQGEQWAVMGPNGSGKSHLAALLAGEAPLRGVGLAWGEGVEDHVALVTFSQQQEQADGEWLQARWHTLDDTEAMSVRNFLSYERVNEINPFEVRDNETAARRAFARLARKTAAALRLAPLANRLMLQLSNGEMRRVLLARALLKAPRLLVLDDPFAGLDPAMRLRLQAMLDRLAADGLSMVLMVRHTDEIPSCVTHLLRLEAGERLASACQWTRRTTAPADADPVSCERALEKRMDSGGAPVIELRDVTVRYGRRVVLDRLTWTVRAGERWVVRGPNGSGKTTLLSLITGDNPSAYAADVKVFGHAREPGESLWPIRRRIGQVSPEIQCYFDADMLCLDAVLSGCYSREGGILRPTRERREAARAWLSELCLEGAERLPFGALSAGHQRLVLLARALLPQPDLLLLDEPCLNLDTESRRLVLGVIARLLRARRDEAVVCVAHRADDVPSGFHRTLVLSSGGESQ